MESHLVVQTSPKSKIMISKKAIDDIISSLPKNIKGIKINTLKTIIVFLKKQNNFEVNLEVRISKEVKLSKKIKEIKDKIETHSLYLTGFKPMNITINVLGLY